MVHPWRLALVLPLAFMVSGLSARIAPTPAQVAFNLAITIDDLPWTNGGSIPASVVAAGTGRMLEALRTRRVTATGFIVCDTMAARPGQIERWAASGHRLGNHTQGHRDLNTTPIAGWLEGVRVCNDAIRRVGVRPTHFRYPMLHRGTDATTRAAAAAGIKKLGYTIAPVTIDNSEWIVATAYEQAVRARDTPTQQRLGALYLDHIRRATDHARSVSRSRFNREVSQILLLHANRLNADWLGQVLDELTAMGARFITLEAALADPVYSLEDGYIGPRGLSWLYRAAPAQPDLAAWDDAEAERLTKKMSGPVF